MRCDLISVFLGIGLTFGPITALATDTKTIYFPADVAESKWVEKRKAEQLKKPPRVYHDFMFSDVQPSSGINFTHRIVDDSGLTYKAVHYDHGSGLAVADVNNDGWQDVYFVNQAGPNALYLNQQDGKFREAPDTANIALTSDIGVAAGFADIDNDGDPDLYVTHVRSPNRLFENQGNGNFKDITETSGLGVNEHSSGVVFLDFDRDGLLDVFVTIVGEYTTDQKQVVSGTPAAEALETPPAYYIGHRDAFAGHLKPERRRASRLFRNLGNNTFADVSQQTGLIDMGWSGDATLTDFNQDGWPDLYVLNMQGQDEYWVNQKGEKFSRQRAEVFKGSPWGAMGVKSFDFNNDGCLDLVLTDMHSDMSAELPPMTPGDLREKEKAAWIEDNWSPKFVETNGPNIYGNALYQNDCAGKFLEVSQRFNVENFWPWGVTAGDINADGWSDLFMTISMNYPFRYAPNSALLNEQGSGFTDAEYVLGVEPRRGSRTSKHWVTVDCETQGHMQKDCQSEDGELSAKTIEIHGALGSRSAALIDYDEDGDLDVITAEFGDVPQVLNSNLAQRKPSVSYIKVKLVGTESNRSGIGARVTLHGDGWHNTQIHDGKIGYLAFGDTPLYFGTGQNKPSHLEVSWPSGKKEKFAVNGAQSSLTIVEGKGQAL